MQILRGRRLESGLFTTALDSALDSKGRPFTGLSLDLVEGNLPVTRTQNFALAEGLLRRTAQSNLWTLLMRYQTQAERRYRAPHPSSDPWPPAPISYPIPRIVSHDPEC